MFPSRQKKTNPATKIQQTLPTAININLYRDGYNFTGRNTKADAYGVYPEGGGSIYKSGHFRTETTNINSSVTSGKADNFNIFLDPGSDLMYNNNAKSGGYGLFKYSWDVSDIPNYSSTLKSIEAKSEKSNSDKFFAVESRRHKIQSPYDIQFEFGVGNSHDQNDHRPALSTRPTATDKIRPSAKCLSMSTIHAQQPRRNQRPQSSRLRRGKRGRFQSLHLRGQLH